MSTTMVAITAVGALVGVGVAGWLHDRLGGRREPARREPEGTARYLRDGGDATYGYDQSSAHQMP